MLKADSQLDAATEKIATAIVNSAYRVHSTLGPGLLERVYEVCMAQELTELGYDVQRQFPVPIEYKHLQFDEEFRIDLLVEDCILCELKSVNEMHPVYQAQLMTYLKLTKKRLGFLMNFNAPLIKNRMKRVVL